MPLPSPALVTAGPALGGRSTSHLAPSALSPIEEAPDEEEFSGSWKTLAAKESKTGQTLAPVAEASGRLAIVTSSGALGKPDSGGNK
ncbi:hypothetical protein T440DRAFT_522993 [Plenodomus tracheiphilus IPT5]|uniref:Uncharacterized protein n=1 Tax=Plenodomus tracheiphilus IPT5 TaxID=1408161 RepID=A0A6A7APL6_9PLEO|nr:hypothetical protein T440DRAFT_522993 [Plenodomus tracheiphilus IPT5]